MSEYERQLVHVVAMGVVWCLAPFAIELGLWLGSLGKG